jgi:hypothetical protein
MHSQLTSSSSLSSYEQSQANLEAHKALWQDVVNAGGPRTYVNKILKEKGVWVARQDVLQMGAKEKTAYIERVHAEEQIRTPLQSKVWAAYTALNIVHLGEDLFWQETVAADLFDSDHRQSLLEQKHLPILDTVDDLCKAMGISLSELRWLSYHREASTSSHYNMFTLPKKSGGVRQIWAPMPKLKAAQTWVLRNIAERCVVHGAVHGFLAGRSIYSNAMEHTNAQVVVSMDLADFFPSFTFKRVKGIFRRAGYLDGIATLLALLCTEAPREKVEYDGQTYFIALGPRCLPQGSPASPALTNTACLRLDRRLSGWAKKRGWRYTRYADDLTFSVPIDAETVPSISQLIGVVHGIVDDEGLKVRSQKTHVMGKGSPQRVTGLIVNGDASPRTPRALRRQVRAMIHNLKVGKGLHADESINHLTGLIAFIHMCSPTQGRALLNDLKNALVVSTQNQDAHQETVD